MFNVVLTSDELSYLLAELSLQPNAQSPLSDFVPANQTKAKQTKVKAELQKGGALVLVEGSADLRVNTILAAALGIVCAPQAMIEIAAATSTGQTKRSFLSFKNTWLGYVQAKNTYILTTPLTEEAICAFVFEHVSAGAAEEQQFVFSGAGILLAAALVELYRAASDKGQFVVTKEQIDKALAGGDKNSTQIFSSIWTGLEGQAESALANFVEQGYLVPFEGNYQLGVSFARLASDLAAGQSLQVSRLTLEGKNAGLRSVTFFQGDGRLVLQQNIPAQLPVVVFKTIDKAEAGLLLTTVIFAAENLARAVTPTAVSPAQPKPATPAPLPTVVEDVSPPSEPALVKEEKELQAALTNPSCSQCGATLSPGAKFCRGCGAVAEPPAVPKCPECAGEVTPGAKFCRHCGAEVRA